MSNQDDLVAALDNHEVTDDDGQVKGDETPEEESATQEETTVEEDATAEKSAETEDESTQDETEGTENEESDEPDLVETASDETGKRYVPESRFKEVYAKWKAAEREKGKPSAPALPKTELPPAGPINKADALEVELLRTTLPQFNPESEKYSREIDELGFSIYESSRDNKGQYSMTRIQAARKALQMAKKITSKVAEVKSEAKTVKAQQSDQGITNRVLTRESTKLDPNKMTLEEKEEWLKANGQW